MIAARTARRVATVISLVPGVIAVAMIYGGPS